MKNKISFLILWMSISSLLGCRDKAKEYKDILREGSWYVYDINSEYKFRTGLTPGLKRYVRYLMDEKNLLFLPGDEISFSGKHVWVRTPGGTTYSYDYHFAGKYVRIGDYGVYYGLKPEGDNDQLALSFDESALRMFLSDQDEGDLLDVMSNLKRFHIIYYLQRPLPIVAQIMSGIYVGELYDGTGQLMNEAANVNLFWQDGTLNLSMDDLITLQDGPQFYIEMAGLQTKEGFTPGSYEFSGSRFLQDQTFGSIDIQMNGRYNAAGTMTLEVIIKWGEEIYQLNFLKGSRQWGLEMLSEKSAQPRMVLPTLENNKR